MKKQYIKPKTTVMQIHSGTHLLTASYNFDNEIVINYLVDDNISANCLCPKTLEYTLHNVPRGTYTVVITIGEAEIYHHKVTL